MPIYIRTESGSADCARCNSSALGPFCSNRCLTVSVVLSRCAVSLTPICQKINRKVTGTSTTNAAVRVFTIVCEQCDIGQANLLISHQKARRHAIYSDVLKTLIGGLV